MLEQNKWSILNANPKMLKSPPFVKKWAFFGNVLGPIHSISIKFLKIRFLAISFLAISTWRNVFLFAWECFCLYISCWIFLHCFCWKNIPKIHVAPTLTNFLSMRTMIIINYLEQLFSEIENVYNTSIGRTWRIPRKKPK